MEYRIEGNHHIETAFLEIDTRKISLNESGVGHIFFGHLHMLSRDIDAGYTRPFFDKIFVKRYADPRAKIENFGTARRKFQDLIQEMLFHFARSLIQTKLSGIVALVITLLDNFSHVVSHITQ